MLEHTRDHLTRQMDIIPLDVLGQQVTIVGAGAIGSFTALQLAKMGFGNLTVIDFDNVEVENLNSQFFRAKDVGKPKVIALKELISEFTEVEITAFNEKYTGGKLSGIIITAVDSMEARKLIWSHHGGLSPNRALIDPRMGAETALLYVVRPMKDEDAHWYKKTLYTDENSVQERCTAKSTIYTANLLSGLVAKTVKDIVTESPKILKTVSWSIALHDFMPSFRAETVSRSIDWL